MTTSDELITSESAVTAANYLPLPVVLTKGEDIYLWDIEGKKYIDMMSAYSAVSHGHCHPKLLATLTKQASQLAIASRAFHTDKLQPFLEALCDYSHMDMALPMNTGAEAVETAIKAARIWGYENKGIQYPHAEILVAKNNFHGRTTTIVGFSTDDEYKHHFGPFTPGFKSIEYGDAKALEDAITPNTCAFLVEPMQGEAGIIIPPKGWLKDVQDICTAHNVLLILDEIQTGLGRTGKPFAFMHEIDKPDGLIVGKALGGGLIPVSAFLSRTDVMECFKPGSHGSTFGGNPLAAAVGLEALTILKDDQLSDHSAKMGDYLKQSLHTMNQPAIKEIRGSGLWVGIDIDPDYVTARQICLDLMDVGILSKETHHTTVRLAPPLTITQAALDHVVTELNRILTHYQTTS